ncbi:LysR family transcriptional regulator [Pseudomonas cavernicola]|uniref:LysR family transcriptional regulator n=1 Tax=Pseudomonas cavernicola TaxID=2320866 RepID=A0A418XF88_9PSED|nr:LysR family transcriptional regulator [Pseudomonas cavernicola]RJG11080.1 LysR family transcriptional regulator [Pseudomonas cavernicola]
MLDLRDLDLNILLAFDAIYSQCSITRAADVMGLSQPAMSNALRRLRLVCNDPLFIKTHLGVTPTLTAHRLAEHVRGALSSLREGLRVIPAQNQEPSQVLRISCLDCLQPLLLDALLDRPGTDWQVRYYQPHRREALAELASGKLDILIDIDQPISQLAGLRKLPLFSDHYVFAHGAALAHVPQSLEEYLAVPQIQVSSRRDGLSPVDLELGLKGLKRNLALTLQSSLAARLIADQHPFGLTLPSRVASALGLDQAPLPLARPIALTLSLYVDAKYRRDRVREQLVERLVTLFQSSESAAEEKRLA